MRRRLRNVYGMAAILTFLLFGVIPGWVGGASATTPSQPRTTAATTATSPLTIKPATLPNAVGALAYSHRLSGSGGAGAPYTFAKDPASKRLPPGLTLKSTGEVSGTPLQVGTFPFTVRVTDTAGNVLSAPYSITVLPGISLKISGYVGSQCSIAGPFSSGTMTVKPFAFGPVTAVKGAVQVPGSNGPSLVTLSLNTLGRSGALGLGWLSVINTTDAQCSAINPVFSLGRPTRMGPAAASGSGWFIATINGVNYTLSVQFTVVTRF